MSNPVIKINKIGKFNDIVKICIEVATEETSTIPQLSRLIDSCFQKQLYKIVLDMQQIKFPSSNFIALLIEKTIQARRVGGDLKLIHISPSATNNLVTFSAISFLSTETTEEYAIEGLADLELKIYKTPHIGETVLDEKEKPIENVAPESVKSEKPTPSKTPPPLKKDITAGKIEFKIKEPEIKVSEILKPTVPPPKPVNQALPQKNPVASEKIQPKKKKTAPLNTKTVPTGENSGRVQPAVPPLKPQEAMKSKMITRRIRVKSKIESLYSICDFVTDLAEKVGFSEKEVGKIKVTVYEAAINVIEHAYHSDPDEWIVTTVQYNLTDFTIIIQDWGESFKFEDHKQYDVDQAVQNRQTGGFGLFIIQRSMDEVSYKTDPINGNRLILMKKIPLKK